MLAFSSAAAGYRKILFAEDKAEMALQIAAFFDIEATPQALAEKFDLEMVIFTKGAAGCEIWHKGNNYYASAPQTTVISTVGAGDAFSAGFLASFLKDQNISQAIQSANSKAAEVLALEGAF